MEEWKSYKLSEIGTIVGGATPSTKVAENYDGDIPWITPKDLSNFSGRFIEHGERNITQQGYDSCSCQMLPKNSVLFSSRAPIGYVAIAAVPLCTNQGFKSVIPNEDIVDPRFLYYLLKFNKNRIAEMGSGTTFMEVSGGVMKNVEVSLPELTVQEHIAEILSSIDDKIELNNRINHNLEEQAKALYKSWFVDFEPFKDGKFVDSELGMIPEGWTVYKLQQLMDIKRGSSPRPIQAYLTNKGLKWLKISDATGCSSPFIYDIQECIKEAGLKNTVYRQKGSLVLSNSATPGLPKFLGIDSCIHDGWLYFENSRVTNPFMYLMFQHFREDLVSKANGSVFINLKTDIVKNLFIALPPFDTIDSFNSVIDALFTNIQLYTEETLCLKKERDSLLTNLMSGKITC